MLKTIVSRQADDKIRLLSLPYINRTQEKHIKKWQESDLIKVVLGPRRAGKSLFALRLFTNQNFAYFNFDDDSFEKDGPYSTDQLMLELKLFYGDTKNILFDEIQNLPKWELFVNRLHRSGYNIVVTGSNAKLLSKELATHLTGRHIPIEIYPFDFQEFLRAKNFEINDRAFYDINEKVKLLNLRKEYLINGGYPEIVIKNLDPRGYLDTLFDSILFKDIVKRYRLRQAEDVDKTITYFVNNISSLYNSRKLAKALEFKTHSAIERYFNYFIESYLLFSLQRYAGQTSIRLKSPKKAYITDNGFVTAKAVQYSDNYGKLMENLVFVELLKRGHEINRDIFYYKTKNNKEVDFALKLGLGISELIQVCYDLSNDETEQREVGALIEASEELKIKVLTIITWDEKREIEFKGKKIQVIPLAEWLV